MSDAVLRAFERQVIEAAKQYRAAVAETKRQLDWTVEDSENPCEPFQDAQQAEYRAHCALVAAVDNLNRASDPYPQSIELTVVVGETVTIESPKRSWKDAPDVALRAALRLDAVCWEEHYGSDYSDGEAMRFVKGLGLEITAEELAQLRRES